MTRLPKTPAGKTKYWEGREGVEERAVARAQKGVDRAAGNVEELEARLRSARTQLEQAVAARDAAADRHGNVLAELAALRE